MAGRPETARLPLPPDPVPYEPAPGLRDLASRCPVSPVELPDGSSAWLVTGFQEAREVLIDQRFSRALVFEQDRPRRGIEMISADGLMSKDPPQHSRLRKLVAGAFTERRIQALRPRVTEIVDELIDAMLAGPRPADLVRSFSLMLPARVICLLLGVPIDDVDRFHAWSNAMFGDWSRAPETINEAYDALTEYMSGLIAGKRENPGDDLIDVLIDARDSGDKLSETELVRFCIGLLAAGHETTANQINLSFVALCQHPDQLARLRADPGLIPGAAEEFLRYVNIGGRGSIGLSRITREEVCLGGVTIPAGETIVQARPIANRDPGVFEDPDRFDVGRAPRTHLAFGAGAHHCLGAQLARMELQEAFRGLLARLPGLRMAAGLPDLEFREGQAIASMRELPVTWDDE